MRLAANGSAPEGLDPIDRLIRCGRRIGWAVGRDRPARRFRYAAIPAKTREELTSTIPMIRAQLDSPPSASVRDPGRSFPPSWSGPATRALPVTVSLSISKRGSGKRDRAVGRLVSATATCLALRGCQTHSGDGPVGLSVAPKICPATTLRSPSRSDRNRSRPDPTAGRLPSARDVSSNATDAPGMSPVSSGGAVPSPAEPGPDVPETTSNTAIVSMAL